MATPVTLPCAARTSVTYTMPASTSLISTFASVDLTSGSRDAGLTVTLALRKTCSAVAPHGTAISQRAILAPGLARSATEAIPAGLPGGVAISIVLLAKLTGCTASPAEDTEAIVFDDAEANTSAFTPWAICAASAELASNRKVTVTPGFAA